MIEVNGFVIQRALKLAKVESAIHKENFEKNITQFESDETREDLDVLFKKYRECEMKIAKLQTLQDQYNILVKVNVRGKEILLAEALNAIQGVGKATKLWKKAMEGTNDTSNRRYRSMETTRDKDTEYAVRAKSVDHCKAKFCEAERLASSYREAFSIGNGTRIKFEGVQDLFTEATDGT